MNNKSVRDNSTNLMNNTVTNKSSFMGQANYDQHNLLDLDVSPVNFDTLNNNLSNNDHATLNTHHNQQQNLYTNTNNTYSYLLAPNADILRTRQGDGDNQPIDESLDSSIHKSFMDQNFAHRQQTINRKQAAIPSTVGAIADDSNNSAGSDELGIALNKLKANMKKTRGQKAAGGGGGTTSKAQTSQNSKIKASRQLLKILEEIKYDREAKIFFGIFFFTLVIWLGTLLLQNLLSSTLYSNLRNIVEVTSLSFQKQGDLISLITACLKIMGVQGDVYAKESTRQLDFAAQIDSMRIQISKLAATNLKTARSVIDLDDQMINNMFSEQISLYERTSLSATPLLIKRDDSFTAIFTVLERGNYVAKNQKMLATPNYNYFDIDLDFLINNVFNSFVPARLISKEWLKDGFNNELSAASSVLIICLILACLIVGLFMTISVAYVIIRNKKSTKFKEVLQAVPYSECKKIEEQIGAFSQIFKTKFDDLELIEQFNNIQKQEKLTYGMRKRSTGQGVGRAIGKEKRRKIHVTQENYSGYMLLLKIIPIILLMIFVVIIFYNNSKGKINDMEISQVRITAFYQSSVDSQFLYSQMISILTNNATMNVNKQPILTEFQKNLKSTDKLQNLLISLKGKDGKIDPKSDAILQDYPCSSISDSQMAQRCHKVANGDDHTSAIQLLDRIYSTSEYVFDEYNLRQKTLATIKELFQLFLKDDDHFLLYLYLDHQLTTMAEAFFFSTVDEAITLNIVLSVVSVIVVGLVGSLTWIYAIKKLTRKSMSISYLLTLIPYDLLSENKYMKNFIIKNYASKLRENNIIFQ